MSNMSYCRFRNTLEDLRDCAENIGDDLGIDESRARMRLVKLCAEIVENFSPEDAEMAYTTDKRRVEKSHTPVPT